MFNKCESPRKRGTRMRRSILNKLQVDHSQSQNKHETNSLNKWQVSSQMTVAAKPFQYGRLLWLWDPVDTLSSGLGWSLAGSASHTTPGEHTHKYKYTDTEIQIRKYCGMWGGKPPKLSLPLFLHRMSSEHGILLFLGSGSGSYLLCTFCCKYKPLKSEVKVKLKWLEIEKWNFKKNLEDRDSRWSLSVASLPLHEGKGSPFQHPWIKIKKIFYL